MIRDSLFMVYIVWFMVYGVWFIANGQ